jgi:hypothetical protein
MHHMHEQPQGGRVSKRKLAPALQTQVQRLRRLDSLKASQSNAPCDDFSRLLCSKCKNGFFPTK